MALVPSTSIGGTGSGSQTLLQTITLGVNGTIDFTAIDQTYNDLLILGMLRGAAAATSDTLAIQINGDGTANYDAQGLNAQAAALSASEIFGTTVAGVGIPVVGNTAGAGLFTYHRIEIPGYTSTTWNKAVNTLTAFKLGTSTGNLTAKDCAAFWRSTAAVSRVTIFGIGTSNLLAGSSARLYGIL